MSINSPASKPHYPILDGLRGIAAIIVVTFHLAEPLATGHLDNLVNHGYLAVDFFFLLSGFVISYAYDGSWNKMTVGEFLKRRIIRLQPMVILGMTLGALGFYFTDSTLWPLIHTVPIWKMLLVMFVGYTILPVPLLLDIRGWEEMHPLNSVGWSLFFEYIANILYAVGIRKFSKTALSGLVLTSAFALAHLAITNGDVSGGWTLNVEQVRIGLTRTMYPFFAGLLFARLARPTYMKNAFFLVRFVGSYCFVHAAPRWCRAYLVKWRLRICLHNCNISGCCLSGRKWCYKITD